MRQPLFLCLSVCLCHSPWVATKHSGRANMSTGVFRQALKCADPPHCTHTPIHCTYIPTHYTHTPTHKSLRDFVVEERLWALADLNIAEASHQHLEKGRRRA